jgi:hypothetical protein
MRDRIFCYSFESMTRANNSFSENSSDYCSLKNGRLIVFCTGKNVRLKSLEKNSVNVDRKVGDVLAILYYCTFVSFLKWMNISRENEFSSIFYYI